MSVICLTLDHFQDEIPTHMKDGRVRKLFSMAFQRI